MKQQQGFTLIELIVVIVILGILAATALPKFTELAAEARISKVKAMMGTMQAASVMARSSQLARGVASGVSVTVEGGGLALMANGYPVSSAAGIGALVDMTDYYTGNLSGSGAVATDIDRPLCNVTYTPATTTAIPTYSVLTATTANCK